MVEVSILPGPERRRKWSTDEKRRIVEESGVPGVRVVDVARRHGLHPNQLYSWRRQARAGEVSGLPDRLGFTAVTVTPEAGADGGLRLIEIVLRNGRLLRLRLGLGGVARLADALESSR
jgi:transposase